MSALSEQQAGFLQAMDAASDGPLAIYRASVQGNQRHALQAAYPVVARLVGSAFFAEAARAYGVAHPSRSGDLHRFGDRFAGFLASYPHAAGLPYLPDVARLEWARHRAALADDARSALGGLAMMDQGALEQARLAWHPSCSLVCSPFAVADLWEANQPGRDGSLTGSWEAPCRLLAWRDGMHVVRTRALDEGEAAFVQASLMGQPLGACVEEWPGEAAALQGLLAALGAAGAVLGPL